MRRGVVQDQVCDECRKDEKSTGHLLWSCPKAREVWSCTKITVPLSLEKAYTFFDLPWGLMMEERVEVDVVAKFVCTAWAIWYNRNVARHGGQQRNGKELVSWVAHYTKEYKEANKGMDCTTMAVEAQDTWSLPLANVFKVNVDAVVFARQKAVGDGVIVRDDKGRLEAVMCKKIQAPLGVMEAEAVAHEAGLVFAKDISIHNFILEGDSLIIHNALCETSNPPSSVATVIQGMQDLCRDF